jgi:pyruvate/2-oxoglutarate dehydrogenase complex dihydrolipoamide dehydrogenase (E3) component
MTIERYQNVVIGSGEAGKILAWNLAKMGRKTAVVARRKREMVDGLIELHLGSKN